MIVFLAWPAIAGVALLVSALALWWYLAPDVETLSRLQSKRYSLSEVVHAKLSVLRDADPSGSNRLRQILAIRKQQQHKSDKHAAEFLEKATQAHQSRARMSVPLFFPLLTATQKLFVLCDLDLVKWVLDDATTFDRARTLESFSEAFRLNSVFTTKDVKLHRDLKSFFTRHTNDLTLEAYETMAATLQRHVDSMLSKFAGVADVPFVPKVEGMVLGAYAESFFGMDSFPDAEECAVLIKQIWQLKSLRNNVPLRRWSPLTWLKLRHMKNRLFCIIANAQRVLDQRRSHAANKMAEVYASNGYEPGNLLNALIPLYEAIARGVVYASIELASSPGVQTELYNEIVHHVHEELKYCMSTETLLHRVWQETLRLHPPTPNQTRRVTTKDNVCFPYGSKVLVLWSMFHQDAEVWGSDAMEFNPGRWLGLTPQQEQHYNPFGKGVQRCVAMNYASFGGRVMLKRLVESMIIGPRTRATTTSVMGNDRGYSRGPDPDALVLQLIGRPQGTSAQVTF